MAEVERERLIQSAYLTAGFLDASWNSSSERFSRWVAHRPEPGAQLSWSLSQRVWAPSAVGRSLGSR